MKEAAQQLLCSWLETDVDGSVPQLLKCLDVHLHEDIAEEVVRFKENIPFHDAEAHLEASAIGYPLLIVGVE